MVVGYHHFWKPPQLYTYMVMFNVFYPWVSLEMAQLKLLRLKTRTSAQDSHLVSTNHGAWGAWETEVLPLPCGKTTHWYSWTGECQGAFYRTQWWELWSRSCEDATTKPGWLLGWLGTSRQFIDTFCVFSCFESHTPTTSTTTWDLQPFLFWIETHIHMYNY